MLGELGLLICYLHLAICGSLPGLLERNAAIRSLACRVMTRSAMAVSAPSAAPPHIQPFGVFPDDHEVELRSVREHAVRGAQVGVEIERLRSVRIGLR